MIYCVRDMKHPKAEKFCGEPGLYDGATLSDDNKTLYLSDWKTGRVTAVIPDLPNSRVIEIDVKGI